jgi:hypothetical protein
MLDELNCYLDDLGLCNTVWAPHVNKWNHVLSHLHHNGFSTIPLKCKWARVPKKAAFLGTEWLLQISNLPNALNQSLHWQLLKPSSNFVLLLAWLTSTGLSGIIDRISWLLWPNLSKLNIQSSNNTGVQTKTKPEAFAQVKVLISQGVLLWYPDTNHPFDIKPDASDYQLGAIIKQISLPLPSYSRTLTKAEMKHSTIEKWLLSTQEVFEDYHSMLWGATIRVYTDHNNLILANFCPQHVLSWRMLVKDFKPEMFYKPGINNIEAGFLTRYPHSRLQGGKSSYTDRWTVGMPFFMKLRWASSQRLCLLTGLHHHAPSATRPRTIGYYLFTSDKVHNFSKSQSCTVTSC